MRPSRPLLGALVAAQVAYPQLPERRRRAAMQGLVALMTATACCSLVERRGRRRGAALVFAAATTGTVAEVVGVRTGRPFGRYHYNAGLGPGLAGVPLGVPAAWTMLAPAAWSAAGLAAGRSPARRVPVAAAALTAWDLALDPRMVRDGLWTWRDGGRYEGVPVSNFVGWLLTGLLLFGGWALLDAGGEPDDGDLALYTWTWIGEVVANLVFWRRPRVALVAGAAMGAVAVPAWRARLGR